MPRRNAHATRRPLGATTHRTLARLRERIAPRLRLGLQLGGRGVASLTIGLVMLALIGLLIANFVGQVLQSARLESDREAIAAEVAALRAENAELEAAVAYAESDVNVERIAREQLGYAREGDIVLLPQMPPAPAPAPAANPDPPPAPPPPPAAPNWRLWWEAFFPAG